MRRGLVIGKFMPLHKGHIALIYFGLKHCDELIVSMSYTLNDPISGEIRYLWLQKTFANHANIRIAVSIDDFDDETLPLEDRTKIWATFIESKFPKIDVVFSSEDYGTPFSRYLQAELILFDQPRKLVPISATVIRNNPSKYLDFLPEVVKHYFSRS
jgi:HTH-type transcriptional repressor of NAD biosynthesis genes